MVKHHGPTDPTKTAEEDASVPHITDAGMRNLEGLTKLQFLVLNHTWITSKGLSAEEYRKAIIRTAIFSPSMRSPPKSST